MNPNAQTKRTVLACAPMTVAGCATITNDPTVPIALSFSDGSGGKCGMRNKRGNWETEVPGTAQVRRSDDVLHYDCANAAGLTAKGDIPSRMGSKIVASAVSRTSGSSIRSPTISWLASADGPAPSGFERRPSRA